MLLAQAWLHTAALQCDDAAELLQRAEAAIGRLSLATVGEQRIGELKRMLCHQRLLLAAAADDPQQTECRARTLQGEAAAAKPYVALTVNALLILAQREQFNFSQVEIAAALARVGGKRWRNGPRSLILHAALAPALFATGAMAAASVLLESALADCARAGPALAAMAALPLAEIALERHDLHRATSLLDEYLPAGQAFGSADHLISGHLTKAGLAVGRGDAGRALAGLDVAVRLALDLKHERFRIAAATSRIRLLLQMGEAEEALRDGRREGLLGPASAMGPPARARTLDEYRAFAWVRLAQSRDRGAEALAVAKRWSAFCAQRGAVRSLVRWHLVMARLQLAAGDSRTAQQELRKALKAGAPGRFIGSFVAEGAAIQCLLQAEYGATPLENSATELFAIEVLGAFGHKPPRPSMSEQGLSGRLSGREIEILMLVSSGLRNR